VKKKGVGWFPSTRKKGEGKAGVNPLQLSETKKQTTRKNPLGGGEKKTDRGGRGGRAETDLTRMKEGAFQRQGPTKGPLNRKTEGNLCVMKKTPARGSQQ